MAGNTFQNSAKSENFLCRWNMGSNKSSVHIVSFLVYDSVTLFENTVI